MTADLTICPFMMALFGALEPLGQMAGGSMHPAMAHPGHTGGGNVLKGGREESSGHAVGGGFW